MIRKLIVASVALTALAVAACKPAVKEDTPPVEPPVVEQPQPTPEAGDTGAPADVKADETGAAADTGAADAGAAEKK